MDRGGKGRGGEYWGVWVLRPHLHQWVCVCVCVCAQLQGPWVINLKGALAWLGETCVIINCVVNLNIIIQRHVGGFGASLYVRVEC